MKYIFTLAALVTCTLLATPEVSGQTVHQQGTELKLDQVDVDVLQVSVKRKFLCLYKTRVFIEWQGTRYHFNNVMDAVNTLVDHGWEHYGSYILGSSPWGPTTFLTFKRMPEEKPKIAKSKSEVIEGDYVLLNIGDQRLPNWIKARVNRISDIDGKRTLTFEYRSDGARATKSLPLGSYDWKPI